MTRRPPADASLDQALAIKPTAATGREATAAHPACRCGNTKPMHPMWRADEDVDAYRERLKVWTAQHGSPRSTTYQRRDCPMHSDSAHRRRMGLA